MNRPASMVEISEDELIIEYLSQKRWISPQCVLLEKKIEPFKHT